MDALATSIVKPALPAPPVVLMPAPDAPANLRKPLALIVDDDEILREVLEVTLQEEGFEVETASDGAQALRCFRTLQPDIVITDATMPVMDGFEFCKALRARSTARHVPVLMLTAAQDTDSIRRAFTCGATDFATKPLQENLIGHRLRYLLQADRNLRELARSESRLAN
ncbi:MAG: PleD family two-component system response regulator, partial [Burkholderiales bacterium]